MAQETNNQVTNNAEAQVVTPAVEQNVEQQNAAPVNGTPADQPAEPEKESKHPKLDAFVAKAKKVGKVVGVGALAIGGLIVANKLGHGEGYQEGVSDANEAFNKGMAAIPDPVPAELPGPVEGLDTPVATEVADVVEVPEVVDSNF